MRYIVVGYIGCPQPSTLCATLREARIVRDLNGGRIFKLGTEREIF